VLKKLSILISLFLLFSISGEAAEITKGNSRAVIIQFDPLEENFVVGDKLLVSKDGKKSGLLEITKVRGGRFLARIIKGTAAPGMTIKRYDIVAGIPKPKKLNEVKEVETNIETVTFRLASTFVWRGYSFRRPYINGTVDLSDGKNIGGLSVENSDLPATSEYDLYVGHAIRGIDWTVTPTIWSYNFPGAEKLNSWDFAMTFAYRIFAIDVSFIPKFSGVDSDYLYLRGSTSFGLGQKWRVLVGVGQSQFSNEAQVGYKNYFDYKLGFLYATPEFTTEFAYTNTNRKLISGVDADDGTAAIILSKTF
jgi:uncharacterized protein (TIGR02001 family)